MSTHTGCASPPLPKPRDARASLLRLPRAALRARARRDLDHVQTGRKTRRRPRRASLRGSTAVTEPRPRAALRRRTPLAPGRQGLKRSGPLTRRMPLTAKAPARARSTLARARKRRLTAAERDAADLWQQQVKASGVCAACGAVGVPLDAHHVIPKRLLRALERRLALPTRTLVWDAANGVALCKGIAGGRCHMRHESAFARVPRRRLPEPALAFATQLGLTWFIERHYPDNDGSGADHGVVDRGATPPADQGEDPAGLVDDAEVEAERS
jgi:hypothetical protein